jgi:hypothetical protein
MDNLVAVQLAQNKPTPSHSDSLSATIPRFGMTILWEFFNHTTTKNQQTFPSAQKGRRQTIQKQQRITILYAIAYDHLLICI